MAVYLKKGKKIFFFKNEVQNKMLNIKLAFIVISLFPVSLTLAVTGHQLQ